MVSARRPSVIGVSVIALMALRRLGAVQCVVSGVSQVGDRPSVSGPLRPRVGD